MFPLELWQHHSLLLKENLLSSLRKGLNLPVSREGVLGITINKLPKEHTGTEYCWVILKR